MKRFYIITLIFVLLLVLFYSYGLSVGRNESTVYPVSAAETDIGLGK